MVQYTIIDDGKMIEHVGSVISSLPTSDTRLLQMTRIQSAARSKCTATLYKGWPDKYSLNNAMRGKLSVVQNILNPFTPKSAKFKTEGKNLEFRFTKLSQTNSTT